HLAGHGPAGTGAAPDPRYRAPGWGDPRQRGKLLDEEALHRPRRDPGGEPGPDLTLRHRPRSGDLVRAWWGDDLPAGPGQRRLHRDPGLEHGRVPPGRVPVGDGGEAARRGGDPRRPAV